MGETWLCPNHTLMVAPAVAAGFSDMAHLSRVCWSMSGVSPSALLQMQPVVASWPV